MYRLSAKVVLLVLTILFVFSAGLVVAQDYESPPGVLSPEEVDFEGETVTFIRAEGSVADNDRLEEAQELFNFEFEEMPNQGQDFPEVVMQRLLSGDSELDVYHYVGTNQNYWDLVSKGAYYPVGDVLPEEYWEEAISFLDRKEAEALEYKDKKYGFGSDYSSAVTGEFSMVAYNKTMITEAGLTDPYELYKEGDWTWEAAGEIARELTADTDGDDEIDQWGMSIYSVNGRLATMFAASNDASLVTYKDNKYQYTLNSPEGIKALSQLQEWYIEDNVVLPESWSDTRDYFIEGKTAMHLADRSWEWRNFKSKMEDEWGVVPYPKGPDAEDYRFPLMNAKCAFLSSATNMPEELVSLVSYLFRPDDVDVEYFVDRYMDTERQYEVFMDAHEKWQGEGMYFKELANSETMNGAVYSVLTGGEGPSSALDEASTEAQGYLDNLFDQ